MNPEKFEEIGSLQCRIKTNEKETKRSIHLLADSSLIHEELYVRKIQIPNVVFFSFGKLLRGKLDLDASDSNGHAIN